MEASQRGQPGRLPMSECPRNFLDSIPSPIAPAPPGSLGYVITKEHVEEMRRMEKLCEADEEKVHREYKPVFLPVDDYLSKEINCELINIDIRSYPWKNTPFGDVYYSPRYNDDRYTYRHVLLTNGVRKEAERVAATVPGGLLTEEVFVHYLGIVLSSGWSHFMLFNKQFKELILRRPKEPETPTTGEEATRIRDGAPGPNDEIDSDSGDDAEQRAAIKVVRSKEAARRQHEELEKQQEQPEHATAAPSSNSDAPAKTRGLSAAAPAAPDLPQSQAKAPTAAAETENSTDQADSDAAHVPNETAPSATGTDPVAPQGDNPQGVVRGSSVAAPKGAAAAPQGTVLQPPRRRRAPLSTTGPQSITVPVLQPTGSGASLSDAVGRARGRAGLRRKEPTVPSKAAAAAATTRNNQVNTSGQLDSAHSVTNTTDGLGVSGVSGQRTTARSTSALRPQPKAGLRRVPATTVAKVAPAARSRGLAEEKPEEPSGKRRLEGGSTTQEKIRGRPRRA